MKPTQYKYESDYDYFKRTSGVRGRILLWWEELKLSVSEKYYEWKEKFK